MESSPITRGR